MLQALGAMVALLLTSLTTAEPELVPRVGDVYEIRIESQSSFSFGEGSSGNSSSRSMLVERVVAVGNAGVEIEFDLPEDTPAEDRAREWQFPLRVLRPPRGPLQLLNGAELERRAEAWLEAAGLPREACGRWYFTWNAFQIECDPDLAIETVAALDRWPEELREGALYEEEGALAPAVLRSEASRPDRAVFVAEMDVDQEAVRRQRAQMDAVVAEVSGESLTPEAALEAHAADRISGTIRITFEADAAGRVRRRTKVTELSIEGADGAPETLTTTETVERRLVTRREP